MNDGVQAIRHGMFIMPFHDPAKPLAQCHDEDLELVVRAEEMGFSEFWIGEHHTMKYETIVMPEIFIARALGETRRIRLGPAPACLNPHPPIAVPGTSRDSPSMRTAGRRGFQPFGHCLIAGNVLADTWKTYEAGAREAGRAPSRADWKVARSIFLADSTPEARRLARS